MKETGTKRKQSNGRGKALKDGETSTEARKRERESSADLQEARKKLIDASSLILIWCLRIDNVLVVISGLLWFWVAVMLSLVLNYFNQRVFITSNIRMEIKNWSLMNHTFWRISRYKEHKACSILFSQRADAYFLNYHKFSSFDLSLFCVSSLIVFIFSSFIFIFFFPILLLQSINLYRVLINFIL